MKMEKKKLKKLQWRNKEAEGPLTRTLNPSRGQGEKQNKNQLENGDKIAVDENKFWSRVAGSALKYAMNLGIKPPPTGTFPPTFTTPIPIRPFS